MATNGFIKLYRELQFHWLWDNDKPFDKRSAWIDLLMMANHTGKKFVLGNEVIELNRGQTVTSELKLMERWGWSKAKVRGFLKLLESDEMIIKKSDNKKTTLTICNYSKWQDSETTEEPQKDHKKTTKRPQKDTNKNVKNVKNENNNIKEEAPPFKTIQNLTISEEEHKKLVDQYGEMDVDDVYMAMENYKELRKKYTSGYLTALSWLKRRKENAKSAQPPPFKKPNGFDVPDGFSKSGKYTNDELERILLKKKRGHG